MKKVVVTCFCMLFAAFVSGCAPEATVQEKALPAPKEAPAAADAGAALNQTIDISANQNKIASYMVEECKKAFSPYYELLAFTLSDYEEKTVDGKVEAIFGYQVKYKNFEKDPDTVDYIKAAKAKGDPRYQQLHDEYLQPKEMNFHLKAVIEHNGSVTLYTNVKPKGIQWEKVVMSDFVLKK
ncbi:hypothetical protein [Brevibacillus agri]|uniref:hypothetical protein n=1 Tax=Brevibacillus agri TaxID=51101 RepID=UPI0030F3D075